MPLAFLLQCGVAGLILAFAVLALAVARRMEPGAGGGFHRPAWALTGAAYLVHGVNAAAQQLWGGLALEAGRESALMASFTTAAPIFNHSRTGLLFGLYAALLWLAVRRTPPDRTFRWAAGGAVALGMAAGALVGWLEGGLGGGPLPFVRHYASVAVWDSVELGLVLAALFALLLSGRADRLLWAALSLYATSLALGALWFTMLSFLRDPAVWTPPVWSLQAMRIVFRLLMVLVAAHRLRLALRGVRVPALSDRVEARAVSLGMH